MLRQVTKRGCTIASSRLISSAGRTTVARIGAKYGSHIRVSQAVPFTQVARFHVSRVLRDDQEQHSIVGASLLPVVNKLQEVCSLVGTDLHLPQIVVIGGQSSGKSSVLENLVGRDFLPRGSGLVTRRPLVIQLNRVENSTEEWGEFAHRPNEKFNFIQIRQEIEAETEKMLGIKSKRIADTPIILKIFAPDVLPLTLVDTPGMTRIPVGDQPQDIEDQIRKMIQQIPNAIILAVHAANQDLATSDGLKLAREADPEGKRTVGVITKLDLMDKGTDAMEILLNKAYPLKLGFVGVVCRSQQDIRSDKPISKALKDEVEWFKGHSTYSAASTQTGTKVLSVKCNRILTKHIRESLPDVKNQVRALIKSTEKELETYGFPLGKTTAEQGWVLMEMLNKFTNQFRSDIEGVREEVVTNQINGGARIYYIFNQTFVKQIQAINPSEALNDQQIRIVLRNASGTKPSLFIPERAFEMLIKKRIEKLKDPSLQVAELILDELVRIAGSAEAKTLSRFPVLRERVGEISSHVLRKCLSPAVKMISDIVDCEGAYINTSHHDFDGPNSVLASEALQTASKEEKEQKEKLSKRRADEERSGILGFLFGSGPSGQPVGTQKTPRNRDEASPPPVLRIEEELTDAERAQIRLMKKLLNSYFDIAQRNVRDNVIKIVMHFLVGRSHEVLGKELVTSLYKEEIFDELLREAEGVVSRRVAALNRLEQLKKAKKVLQITELKDMPLQFY